MADQTKPPVENEVKIDKSTVIDAPVEQVWAVLRDFNLHDKYHPAVAAGF